MRDDKDERAEQDLNDAVEEINVEEDIVEEDIVEEDIDVALLIAVTTQKIEFTILNNIQDGWTYNDIINHVAFVIETAEYLNDDHGAVKDRFIATIANCLERYMGVDPAITFAAIQ